MKFHTKQYGLGVFLSFMLKRLNYIKIFYIWITLRFFIQCIFCVDTMVYFVLTPWCLLCWHCGVFCADTVVFFVLILWCLLCWHWCILFCSWTTVTVVWSLMDWRRYLLRTCSLQWMPFWRHWTTGGSSTSARWSWTTTSWRSRRRRTRRRRVSEKSIALKWSFFSWR